jgi:hypothetical protein
MQTDPLEEWRRLTALYAEMGDVEIRELANQVGDLTESAQQVLRDEMKKRGISAEHSGSSTPNPDDHDATVNWEPASYRNEISDQPDDGPQEFTWKVPLCECDTTAEARQVAEALRRAGIDSWIEGSRSRWGIGGPRLVVGADQLEEARRVASQPIPQDVIDATADAESAAEYELPVCPKCKAPDPTLESAEPSNNWLCESCGYAWSEPLLESDGADDPQGEK